MKKTCKLAEYFDEELIKIDNKKLLELKDKAKRSLKKRYRFCLHSSEDDHLHEMVICRLRDSYSRPDKHLDTSESHIIIEGSELIIIFSDLGDIIDAFILNRENGVVSYRVKSNVFHMTVALSDYAIDYEVKLGPFTDEVNIYPNWAPVDGDEDGINNFMRRIMVEIGKYI